VATEEYVFSNLEHGAEVKRFRFIEQDDDMQSQARLKALGLGEGAVCLEAGTGAGSMARWMAHEVGDLGKVIGLDIDDRFFPLMEPAGVELQRADVRVVDFSEQTFDFIHARLFLEHFADRSDVLARFRRWLKPGGWVVLADSDYSFGWRGGGAAWELWTRMQRATSDLVAANGVDFEFGLKLPEHLRSAGFESIGASGSFPVVVEGAGSAGLLQGSFDVQRKMLDLSDVRDEDLDELRGQLPLGDVVKTGYVMIHGWGRRPHD
jgi:SAM-dependent methyltransferase